MWSLVSFVSTATRAENKNVRAVVQTALQTYPNNVHVKIPPSSEDNKDGGGANKGQTSKQASKKGVCINQRHHHLHHQPQRLVKMARGACCTCFVFLCFGLAVSVVAGLISPSSGSAVVVDKSGSWVDSSTWSSQGAPCDNTSVVIQVRSGIV